MSAADIAIARQLFGGPDVRPGDTIDVREVFANPAIVAGQRRLIAPDAPIEFATPDAGFIGDMAGPFVGPEGMVAGWSEWLEPWDTFLIRTDEWIDLGDGRVLVLAHAGGTLSGSGAEVETPVGALYTIANGQVAHIEHFLDQEQAKAAAGLSD